MLGFPVLARGSTFLLFWVLRSPHPRFVTTQRLEKLGVSVRGPYRKDPRYHACGGAH